ncbi:MAG TPA: ABC transporter substrate-binding protein [Stellaceae bacterium]|nr:ABC transporter substrate-binding protein [Stellaceae bacterium]
MQDFATDAAEIIAREKHRVGRRRFLLGAAALGIAPSLVRRSLAAVPEVVLCNWGGDAMKAFAEAFVAPYEKATGGKLVLDGSGPSNGKMRAMVEAKHVTWDICDSGVAGIGELGPRGMLEPIDYTVVDRNRILPEFGYEFGVVNYMFSTVMAWDTKVVKTTPTLADFFDLKKFPGKRMLRKDSQAMLELALMADGVAPDKLYPLDLDRAMRKISAIKSELLYWDTGAQSQNLLRSGEVSMGWLWHTRANLLKLETKGGIDWSFAGGLVQPGLWVVPKGNPAGKQAMVAIASMQDPAGQVTLLGAMGNGPGNPQAASMVPDALQAVDPGTPANLAVQAKINAAWYQANYGTALKAYLDMISS